MTTIITAAGAAQFLALVPALLGYTPTRSVVLIPFAGSRSCGGMRFDLPEHDIDAAAATMIGFVCRTSEADALTIAVFTDEEPSAGVPPHRALIDALRGRADACGIEVRDALRAGPTTWGSYRGGTGDRPIAEIRLPATAAAFSPSPGDQSAGVALPPRDPARRRSIGRGIARLERALRAFDGDAPAGSATIEPAALDTLALVSDPVALFESALSLDPDALPRQTATALVWLLSAAAYRSSALIQWATDARGGVRAQEAEEEWRETGTYDEASGEVLWGIGSRPDPDRLHAALTLTRRLAADAPNGRRASILSLCAWLSWALGRSTHAAHYADEALARDGDLVIAELVSHLVAAAHLPGWAFRATAAAT